MAQNFLAEQRRSAINRFNGYFLFRLVADSSVGELLLGVTGLREICNEQLKHQNLSRSFALAHFSDYLGHSTRASAHVRVVCVYVYVRTCVCTFVITNRHLLN